MKKRVISMILGASMLLTANIASAAVTKEQMNIGNQYYRNYNVDNETVAPIANKRNDKDMEISGDWVYIARGPRKSDGSSDYNTPGYVIAYNTTTGRYFELENMATIDKEGVTATNETGSSTKYYYYPSSIDIYGDYLYVSYHTATGTSTTNVWNGGIRIYDISNAENPVDVTGKVGTTDYTGIPSGTGPTAIIEAISDDLVVTGSIPNSKGIRILSTTDKSNCQVVYTDTDVNGANVTNIVYDEVNKYLYVLSYSTIYVYNLSDISNVVKCGTVSAHSSSSTSGKVEKGAFAKTEDGFVVVTSAGASVFNINVSDEGVTTEHINFATLSKKNSTVHSFMINGDYVYLGTGNDKNSYFEIHDISNLANGNTSRIYENRNSNYRTQDDGTTLDSNGTYGKILCADGNKVGFLVDYIGPQIFTIGKDLIVPDENGIIYKNGDEIVNGITSGNISVTTEISNVSFEDKAPYVVTALYNDETLEMEKIEFEAVTVKAGENVKYPQTIAVPATGDYHIETFVFYDLDEILAVETGNQGILE